MKTISFLVASLFFFGCSAFRPNPPSDHDPQVVQILFRSGLDELDTFHGTYQKDCGDTGIVKTTMWLSAREQEILIQELEDDHFFSQPDTIGSYSEIRSFPYSGPELLRVKYNGLDKTVVIVAANPRHGFNYGVIIIMNILLDIIKSKPEYKALPPWRGSHFRI